MTVATEKTREPIHYVATITVTGPPFSADAPDIQLIVAAPNQAQALRAVTRKFVKLERATPSELLRAGHEGWEQVQASDKDA
jgi:hypothetical protein